MGDANPICTLGDYFKPSHGGYKNTIELPVGNNVVPLRSDTNRTTILQNDILTFHQHHGESLSEAWTRFKYLLQKVPHYGIYRWLQIQIFYEHVSFHLKCEIDRATGGNIRNKNPDESWKIIEKLALYDHEGWNDAKEFIKTIKAISTPQPTSKTGATYEAILRKKITKKEDIGGNFEIPSNIGGLKHMNASVDQASDVNVMTLSAYVKLTDERPVKTDIRLSLASYSYIYPLGITKDILVEVAEHVYPVDFVILDIKENEKRPFILGTSFLRTTKAMIKFDKGTITQGSGKNKISFNRIPESLCKDEKGLKNDIEPIAPTMTINRLVLEW
ncbi:MAK10-like protein [Tanacetum coccineum]